MSELKIVDYTEEKHIEQHTTQNIKPMPESFGRNLDTLEKARLWLTNPHNWHIGKLFILKWNGLLPTVMEEHGRRLIENPQDDGLPWCVVYEQRKRKAKNARGEQMEDPEVPQTEE
jgi:hypothetical protein